MNDHTDLLIAERFAVFDGVEPPDTWDRAVTLSVAIAARNRSVRAWWFVAAALVLVVAAAASIVATVGGEQGGQRVETPPAEPGEPDEAPVPSVDLQQLESDPTAGFGGETGGWLVAFVGDGAQTAVVVDLDSGEQLVIDAPQDGGERFIGGGVRPNGDVVLWSRHGVYLYEDQGTAAPRVLGSAPSGGVRAELAADGSAVWFLHRPGPLDADDHGTSVRLIDIETGVTRSEVEVDDAPGWVHSVDGGLVLQTLQWGGGPDGTSGVPGSERLYLVSLDGRLRELPSENTRAFHASGRFVLMMLTPPASFEVMDLADGNSWTVDFGATHHSTVSGALSSSGEVVAVLGESPVDGFGRFPRVVVVSVFDGSAREIWQSDGPGPIRATWAGGGEQIVVVQDRRVLLFDPLDLDAGPSVVGQLPDSPTLISAG